MAKSPLFFLFCLSKKINNIYRYAKKKWVSGQSVKSYIYKSFSFAKKTGPFMKREGKICIFTSSLFSFEERRPIMLESEFQSKLIKELKVIFPGCLVLKNDPNRYQGIPDLLILYKDKWASLEVKKSANAKKRPNQELYVERMNDMSFSRFIFPENKEEVLDELQRAFEA